MYIGLNSVSNIWENKNEKERLYFSNSDPTYYTIRVRFLHADGASGSTTLTSYLEPRALKIEVRIFICGEWCGYQVKWLSGGWPL